MQLDTSSYKPNIKYTDDLQEEDLNILRVVIDKRKEQRRKIFEQEQAEAARIKKEQK